MPTSFPNGARISGMTFPQSFFEGITSGTHYYVHNSNGLSTNDGTSAADPLNTVINAVAAATANKHDVIWCLPGHIEYISSAAALSITKADITIICLGSGSNRAQFLFDTSVNADIDIDAAGITFVRPRFVAGIDALTGPIDVNAADFTIIDGVDYDAPGMAATDMIVADANADRMRIIGYKYFVSSTGTQKQSRIQVAEASDILLRNIDLDGDFGTGAIENGTAWVRATLRNVNIDNQNAGPVVGILLQATSSGSMHNVHIRVASGTTYLTAANDMQFFGCLGVGVDADAGEVIGATQAASVEGKIDVIDAYHDVATADATTNAVMSDVTGNKADAAAAGAVSTVESLMAYIKQNVGELRKLDAATLTTAPVSDSLAAFIASGGTALGTELNDSESLVDILYGTNGIVAFPAAGAPANGISLAEVIRELFNQMEKGISGSDAVMVNADTIFTIAGGPIEIMELVSECITLNDATASTLQYSADPTVGAATTISGASASLANAAAGSGVVLNQTALATAPDLIDPLVGLTGVNAKGIVVGAGIITVVIGVGSTTGTWRHHLRYRPLRRGVTVTAA